MIFIRHRTAENNQRLMSHGFKTILFGDNIHYVDLFPIGVLGKSGTTKIWGGAFAPPASLPPAPPLATPLMYLLISIIPSKLLQAARILYISSPEKDPRF